MQSLQIFMIFADSHSFHALYSNCCQFAVSLSMLHEVKHATAAYNREHENKLSVSQVVFCLLLYMGVLHRNPMPICSLMVRWIVGSILHGVNPLSYFSFQPVLHDWCNKGRGMCCPVCGMVHIKEPLLLIGKSSLCGSSGIPFSLSEWSLTICLMPYNRK